MSSLNTILARKLLKSKNKKLNGFTLIELMVVVAILGVLTSVGLPELSKAQDRAKDAAAETSLTNAAKECSLSLILNNDDSDYEKGTAAVAAAGTDPAKDATEWVAAGVTGDCVVDDGTDKTVLTATSETGQQYQNTFNGNTPGINVEL